MTDVERLLLEALEQQTAILREIRDALQPSLWSCGCGHVNGANLAVCVQCGRTVGEREIRRP